MRNKVSGVYCIKNLINGKIYVGSSKNMRLRFDGLVAGHKTLLNEHSHKNIYLQVDWNKYGEESFELKAIEYVSGYKCLLLREQYYLDILRPFFWNGKGYNICNKVKTVGIPGSKGVKKIYGDPEQAPNWHKDFKNLRNNVEKLNYIKSLDFRLDSVTVKEMLIFIKLLKDNEI